MVRPEIRRGGRTPDLMPSDIRSRIVQYFAQFVSAFACLENTFSAQSFAHCRILFPIHDLPRSPMFCRDAEVGVVLGQPDFQVCRRTRIKATRRQAPQDINECHCRDGAPGEIRTPDLMLRRHPLYPAELRARFFRILRRPRTASAMATMRSGGQLPQMA